MLIKYFQLEVTMGDGIADRVRTALHSVDEKINSAFIFGSIAKANAEEMPGRPVNQIIYTQKQYVMTSGNNK